MAPGPAGHPEAPDAQVAEDERRRGYRERRAAHRAVCDERAAGRQLTRHFRRRRAADAVQAEPGPRQLARFEQLRRSEGTQWDASVQMGAGRWSERLPRRENRAK